MRTRSPHTAAVLAALPSSLARELDTAEVTALVDALVAAGWRTGQVAGRIGAAPASGSLVGDAAAVPVLLRALFEQIAPDVAHARTVAERRRPTPSGGATPAAPEVRERALAEIRARLGTPAPRPAPAPVRTRPPCCLCDGEGSYFVTREVHLCRRCVTAMATGEARLSVTG